MAKTQKQLQSEQTRQKIIEEAAGLFVRKGFYGTSVSDLAQATGMTKGALYHHFENKEAVFFAVIESVRETWRDAVVRDVLGTKDAIHRLAILIDNHTHLMHDNPTLCLVMHGLVAEMQDVNPDFSAALIEVYVELTEFIERIILKGQKNGQVRSDLDAKLVALSIVGMLRGSCCSPLISHLNADYLAVMELQKQIILDSLQP